MANRRGGLSIVRVSIIAAIIGIVLIGAAAVTYLTDQASKRTPLDVALIPGASYWGTSEQGATSRKVFYLSSDTPEAVAYYYQKKLQEQYQDATLSCVRFPATGNAPNSDTNVSIALYIYRCMFDNSGFNSSQFTQVEIYPGRPNEDPALDADGFTIIKYEQQWQS
jgi:hypothetical protein